MERRDFLKSALAASVPVVAGGILDSFATAAWADEPQPGGPAQSDETVKGEMIYRPLGKTGQRVSVIGLGGFHIGMQWDEKESVRIIRQAVDHGINFMDNSWDYNGGESEIRMGKALEDGYRDKVFLMTKIDGRTKQAAAAQIDESLKRLKTDRIDLMQHHEVIRLEDPDRIFAPGGAQEAMLDARKAGKIRFIGFTGHKDPTVHLRMLDMADKHDFRFDAVQMPLSVMDAHFRSFEKKVLPLLVKKEIGVLGMKSMGSGVILRSNVVKPVECLHYAMSLPTATVITGIDSLDILRQDLDAVRDFKPLTSQQIASLLERTAQAAAEGRFEPFKTGNMFDSTAHNPRWLG
ncbi:MAG: aldo/keto reductase [Thermoguttaceae bacterium]|jgi:predicted aldo/keto reductase-like oxidoreductase